MTLAELRKLSIRQQLKIHFRLRNGMECIVNERGTAQVPALNAIPDFNLEEELSFAGEFLLEPVIAVTKKSRNAAPAPRRATRDEVAAMTSSAPAPTPSHEDE